MTRKWKNCVGPLNHVRKDQLPGGSKIPLHPAQNKPSFKKGRSEKGLFYQEGINKALSDMMEHHVNLRKVCTCNNIH